MGGQVEIWDKDLRGLSGNIGVEIPIIPLGGWEKETTSHWILSFWNHSHSKTSRLLPSTMWPELGVSYNSGLVSLIITSPNSDGGWQLYPPSHPQLIIKLKKWKSTLINDPRVNSPFASTAWWISRPSKHTWRFSSLNSFNTTKSNVTLKPNCFEPNQL